MAKNDKDLFERLRQAGLRKQVAKTLSELGEGTSKKAARTAQSAIADLRSLAEEIERRLPGDSTKIADSAPARRTIRAKAPARTRAAAKAPATKASAAKAAAATPARKPATTRAASTRTAATRTASTRRKPAATRAATARPKAATTRATTSRRRTPAAAARTAAASASTVVRAPRGANKAKILGSLKTGAKTASQIAAETGIGAGTVSSTLTKLATSGEVVKAARGYGLPK
jgi:hypothetical protein